MKNLLLSSIFAIAICGCSLGHYKKLNPVSDSGSPLKPIFGDHFSSFLFKANLNIYRKNFGGLLVLKQMQPADYRVIFTTELGMKLVDFEFTDSAFTLHYCVPQLNRPALLKTIQQDIAILLMNTKSNFPVEYFTDPANQYIISKIRKDHAFSDYYFKEKKSQQLVKIEHAKKQRKKITFALENDQEGIPARIRIQHHDIKLNIELTLLKK